MPGSTSPARTTSARSTGRSPPGPPSPHVRDTISDRELEVWALLDVTPSMNWGTEGVTKRDLGIAAIATIGFLSQKMGDRFGGYIMRPDNLRRLPARSGRSARCTGCCARC